MEHVLFQQLGNWKWSWFSISQWELRTTRIWYVISFVKWPVYGIL